MNQLANATQELAPGSAVEGFPVALDLQGTIHQEVKSPAISVNLSGALPTITGGATSIPTSVAERVRPTVTVEEHVPSCMFGTHSFLMILGVLDDGWQLM